MKLEQERSTVTPTSTRTASVKAVITLLQKKNLCVSLQQSTPKTNISKCRVVGILYLLSCSISKYSCLFPYELLHCVVLVGLWRDKGSGQLLFLRKTQISFIMPKTNEIRANGNNSTVYPTSSSTKAVITLLQKKNLCVSLQRTRQVHVLDIICSSYFYGYALRLYCKDIEAIVHMGLLRLCNNLDLAVREAIAFLISITQIS